MRLSIEAFGEFEGIARQDLARTGKVLQAVAVISTIEVDDEG
jgi:hypothetical protein